MDLKELWNQKWKNISKQLPETDFAKKCSDFLKEKENKNLLEIGCGDGKDSIYFAEKGFEVTALDFSQEAIFKLENRVKEKNIKNITTKVQDIRNMDFPEDSFDIIYSNLSLHYFNHKDTVKIIKELYGLLKKDGYIFIKCKSTKDRLFLEGKKIEEKLYLANNKEYNFFDEEYIKTLLENLEIISIENSSSELLNMDNKTNKSHFIEAIARKK